MSAVVLLLLALVWFTVGYRVYGRLMTRVVGVDPSRDTPAVRLRDDVDYVPARSWVVLFGHHFSSICGAGPIVGPALAVAYWGWGPAFVWILVGSVLMGAVSDFVSLFVSVRSDGRSIPEIARPEISSRARLLFSWFIWLSLILVIAVFAIFAARTFIKQPDTVIPSFTLIPVALLTGFLMYRTRVPNGVATALGVSLLGLGLFAGVAVPLQLPSVLGLSPESVWIIGLLAYCFVASVTPVQVLLQPRDYLAGFLLFGAIAVGCISIVIGRPVMQGPAFHGAVPAAWPDAGPIWPMLFVTIACGAISGFHSLVSSGTTCKQLANEAHGCRIGYGGMLIEGLVGILVLIAVGAALSAAELGESLRAGGPIAAFGKGFGDLSAPLLGSYGTAFAVLALNAFILTTLDTATRIGRYLTQELFQMRSTYAATAVVVVAAAGLALTGQWQRIWPAFGASNQLIGALALLVGSCWLVRRGRPVVYTLVPACIMLVTTVGAFAYQIYQALERRDPVTAGPSPDWFIAGAALILIVLALSTFWEGVKVLRNGGGRSAMPMPGV
jgi:carbon starvation protein